MTLPLADADDRRQIREALDETLVVEAAAGTGKTTELVHRMINVLAEGRATVDRIVAVTFTEKAAGELKLRLRSGLEAARARSDHERIHNDAARVNLDQALAHLEEARVGTIHAFSADLLRERPVEAGVDPNFEVLPEAEAERLYDQAFDLWLQETLENPPEGVRRALRRSAWDETGRGAAQRGAGAPAKPYLGSEPGSREAPSARLRRAGWTLAEWRDFPAGWRRDPFARDEQVDALVAGLHEVAELTSRAARTSDFFYRDTARARRLSDDIRWAEQHRPRDYDGLEAALIDLGRDNDFKRQPKPSGAEYGPGLTRAEVHAAHGALVAALHVFVRAADADLAARLQQELREPLARYEGLKDRMGRLDFVDLLVRTRDLLREDEAVRADFQQRFTHIFVDEFQDTDPLQAEILLLLASADPAERRWRDVTPVPGKLFIVGDPKQSIYRFRRADVGVYQDVKTQLIGRAARLVHLKTSFRASPAIQNAINMAFAPLMTGDRHTLQADYVPLAPHRPDPDDQPALVALPVPRPYGSRRVAAAAIEESLPDAVGAFVDWLLSEPPERRWTVTRRDRPGDPVPVEARDICLLFRRFERYRGQGREEVTREYVQALDARGVPHLLVGGKSFHQREEVETVRAALEAIEWPEDELSVFATLKGALFAVGDEALLEYRHRIGRLNPFRVPAEELPEKLVPIVEALRLLRKLHRDRNQVPAAETIGRLLQATRAHAGLVLRRSGEQALANVLQIAELARRYEASGGVSFRGFVERLRPEWDDAAAEAPILEEGSDGVRIMTVHKAKGLEFPVVILADLTANLSHAQAGRYLDAGRRLCALRLAGWSPAELLEHEAEEVARDQEEGIRVAYVAATRARDLLVVPAVGDAPYDGKWLSALNPAIYPPPGRRRAPMAAPGCPRFGKDSVFERPEHDPAGRENVCPGLHRIGSHGVVWWDPSRLDLGAETTFSLRHENLIHKDVDRRIVDAGRLAYDAWAETRQAALDQASRPTLRVLTAVEHVAHAAADSPGFDVRDVALVELDRQTGRPLGPRYGTLVHALLSLVPLDAQLNDIQQTAALQGRMLGATPEEVASASAVVQAALASPVLARARDALAGGRCRRETPVTWRHPDGTLVEGTVDLAFEEESGWTVVDFKTDRDLMKGLDLYRRQVRLYADIVSRATGKPASAVLMHV